MAVTKREGVAEPLPMCIVEACVPMASVLVVDDYEDTRELLRTVLSSRGHAVYLAADGEQGVRLAGDCRPNVVVMDLFMPNMDGFEATRRIRAQAQNASTRVIAYTARPTPPDPGDGLFDAVCMKPCPLHELLALIDQVIAA